MAGLCFYFKSPLFLLCFSVQLPGHFELWNQTEYIRNPQIQKSSQFLPPLLSPFTFPRVFLLHFSSYPFCLPTFAFRTMKEEGEMENQRDRVSKAGLSLGNLLLYELVAIPSLPSWCLEFGRLHSAIVPLPVLFPHQASPH